MTEFQAPPGADAPALHDTVAAALRKAFNLGQTYWQQADSESYSQNAKSDITRGKFDALLDETTATVLAAAPSPVRSGSSMVATTAAGTVAGPPASASAARPARKQQPQQRGMHRSGCTRLAAGTIVAMPWRMLSMSTTAPALGPQSSLPSRLASHSPRGLHNWRRLPTSA
jgi:hypothetical protein